MQKIEAKGYQTMTIHLDLGALLLDFEFSSFLLCLFMQVN